MRGIHVAVGLALGALALVAIAAAAGAATFTVNTADDADDGACDAAHCSLREAILAANANEGQDRVAFEVPGDEQHVIELAGPLPPVTEALLLDGLTQPGAPTDPWAPRPIAVTAPMEHGPLLLVEASDTMVRGIAWSETGDAMIAFMPAGSHWLENITFAENFVGSLDGHTTTSAAVLDVTRVHRFSLRENLVIGLVRIKGHMGETAAEALVEENRIGVDATGLLVRERGRPFVAFTGAEGRIVSNVISTSGVALRVESLRETPSHATIQANHVGVAIDGQTPLEFGDTGIRVGAGSGALVGGPDPEHANVIGNMATGIEANGPTTIQGNFIGADRTGSRSIPVRNNGILILEGEVLENVIGSSGRAGIFVRAPLSAPPVTIEANRIGVGTDGSPIPNGHGVLAGGFASYVLGADTPDRGNQIMFNEGAGLFVDGGTQRDRFVRINSIFANAGKGISYTRTLLPTPAIEAAGVAGGWTLLAGSVPWIPGLSEVVLDLYTSPVCDGSRAGEGRTYLGSTPVPVDEDGGKWSLALKRTIPEGHIVSAVANGRVDGVAMHTEFSPCARVMHDEPASHIGVGGFVKPLGVEPGGRATLTVDVRNGGPAPARATHFHLELPSGLVVLDHQIARGACTATAHGLDCDLGVLPMGTERILVELLSEPEASGELPIRLEATSAHLDRAPEDNVEEVILFVGPSVDLVVTVDDVRDPVRVGELLDLVATVENEGPSDATGVVLEIVIDPTLNVGTVTSTTGSCEVDGDRVTCDLGGILAGGHDEVHLELVPSIVAQVRSTATASANEVEARPGDEADGERTRVLPDADLVVNTVDDDDDGACDADHCSLREAILAANARADRPIIGFDVPGEPPHTILLSAPLPRIEAPMRIEGTTDPDRAPGEPPVAIEGSALGLADGLGIEADTVVLEAIGVRSFEGNGIVLHRNDAVVTRSIIRDNAGAGIVVLGGSGNSLRLNMLTNNGGLGIDLGGDSVTTNDDDDRDTGPNGQQNFPVLTLTTGPTIRGFLESEPGETYVLDLYWALHCDPSGHGEALEHFRTTEVTLTPRGRNSFEVPAAGIPSGVNLVMTATGPDGSTSEFSACEPRDDALVPIPELGSGLLTGAGLVLLLGLAARRRKTWLE